MTPLRIDIITLFPEMHEGPLSASILGRARRQGLVDIRLINLRDYALDRHKRVDERPYGGGPGMVMMPEPIFNCVESLRSGVEKVIFTSPCGKAFKQADARRLSQAEHLIILCGHYEGVDQRVIDTLVDEEISIGDYVLTSGNLAALVLVDAMTRLLPGALGCEESALSESFSEEQLLEYPQYTRPELFRGMDVPPVLLSGHHTEIGKWRRQQSLERTQQRRPDLLKGEKP